jgi:hypothetical protein
MKKKLQQQWKRRKPWWKRRRTKKEQKRKRRKGKTQKTHLNIWFGLGQLIWVHPKMAKPTSTIDGWGWRSQIKESPNPRGSHWNLRIINTINTFISG